MLCCRERDRDRDRERERDRDREDHLKVSGGSGSDDRHRVGASPSLSSSVAERLDKHSRARSPPGSGGFLSDLESKRRKEERAAAAAAHHQSGQESDGEKSDQDLVVDVANEVSAQIPPSCP